MKRVCRSDKGTNERGLLRVERNDYGLLGCLDYGKKVDVEGDGYMHVGCTKL